MKWLKRFLLFIFLILIIFIAGAVVVYLTYDPQKLLQLLSNQLRKDYSIGISAQSIKLDLLKGINLKKVKLIDTSKEEKTIASFDEGGILYNPILLLNKKIDILRISVSGMKSDYNDLILTVSNIMNKKFTKNDSNSFQLTIHSIALSDAEIQYQKLPIMIKAECIIRDPIDNSLFKGELNSPHGKVDFIGNWNKMHLFISKLELGYFVKGADAIIFHQLDSGLEKADKDTYLIHGKNIDMTVDPYRGQSLTAFEGTYSIGKQMLFISNAGLQVGKSQFQMESLHYDLSNLILNLRISSMQALMQEFVPPFAGDLFGSLEMKVVETNLILSGGLSFSNYQFLFIKNGSGEINLFQNEININAGLKTTGGDMIGKITSKNIFNGPYAMEFQGDSLDIEPIFLNIVSNVQNQTNQTNSMTLPLQFTLKFDSVRYKKLKFEKGYVKAGFEDNVWTISEAGADIFRGNMNFKGSFAENILDGSIVYSDGKLKDFTSQFLDGEKKLYGTMSFKSSFRLDLARLNKSSGEILVDVKNGEIKELILQDKFSRALFDIPLNNLFFDSIRLQGNLNKGLFGIKEFSYNSDSIRMKADGILYITNQNVDMNSELSITKDYLSGLPNVAQIFTAGYEDEDRVNFKFRLKGNYQKPEVILEKP